jgi:hypothetical protein
VSKTKRNPTCYVDANFEGSRGLGISKRDNSQYSLTSGKGGVEEEETCVQQSKSKGGKHKCKDKYMK